MNLLDYTSTWSGFWFLLFFFSLNGPLVFVGPRFPKHEQIYFGVWSPEFSVLCPCIVHHVYVSVPLNSSLTFYGYISYGWLTDLPSLVVCVNSIKALDLLPRLYQQSWEQPSPILWTWSSSPSWKFPQTVVFPLCHIPSFGGGVFFTFAVRELPVVLFLCRWLFQWSGILGR